MSRRPSEPKDKTLDKIVPKRLKAGRKPAGDNSERSNRVPRTVRIDKDVLELAQALCWWRRVSFNEWVESILLGQIKMDSKELLDGQGVPLKEILKKYRQENSDS